MPPNTTAEPVERDPRARLAPLPDAAPAPTGPDPRAWVAPLLSSLVTVPLILVSLFFAGLSQMACGACTEAELDRFDPSFGTAFDVFRYGLLVPAALLLASWFLPWRRRHAATRIVLAVLAPFTVAGPVLAFAGLVDWP
ncbi:hypothetical protein ACIBCB_14575 [Streptomyces uncialis]|uniref:hypothetical protein n=1 Tax=Streptomyces uncialis TaxID=1048205 RepID=UPI0037B025E8